VNEAWRLFERWKVVDNSFIDLVTYLSTHPETGDRIEDMRAHAEREGWKTEGEITPLHW
jgi:predicted Zn-dependent protease